MRLIYLLFSCSLLLAGVQNAAAQDFLRAGYAGPTGKPTLLNVCGDTDVATYRIEQATGAPAATAIEATVHLFRGMRAVGLDASRSSPGGEREVAG